MVCETLNILQVFSKADISLVSLYKYHPMADELNISGV